jgi:hypothetical protein
VHFSREAPRCFEAEAAARISRMFALRDASENCRQARDEFAHP